MANMLHTTVDQLLLDSYDYKEQVIMRDLYERIDKFPVKTKILTCCLLYTSSRRLYTESGYTV